MSEAMFVVGFVVGLLAGVGIFYLGMYSARKSKSDQDSVVPLFEMLPQGPPPGVNITEITQDTVLDEGFYGDRIKPKDPRTV